jgi:hypothetical protein
VRLFQRLREEIFKEMEASIRNLRLFEEIFNGSYDFFGDMGLFQRGGFGGFFH